MSEELKPCPFCGSNKARKHKNVWKMYTVVCEACGASIGNWYSEVQAADVWNTRLERTCRNEGTVFDELEWCYVHDLSCGHVSFSDEREPPSYCYICGAKVVK